VAAGLDPRLLYPSPAAAAPWAQGEPGVLVMWTRTPWLVLIAMCVAVRPALASDPPDLTGLSVEELAGLDMVYAASRHSQSQRQAPAFVTIVTANEIRRYGHRTLADVLRQVPGFYISNDHGYSYVGVRGFARPGDFSSRVLVLVDGARINDNVYDAALVGQELEIDLALVDRVEIVRGPGAALYGNNAIFAVINVITRRGQSLEGGEIALEGGTHEMGGARATYGRRLPSGLDLLASVSGWRSSGPDLYFPELDAPGIGDGHAIGINDESSQSAFLSLSYRGFTLRAHRADRQKVVPTAAFGAVFGDARNWTEDRNMLVAAEYEGASRGWSYSGRATQGRSEYRGSFAYPGDDVYHDGSDGAWWGLDAHATAPALGRHRLTFGGDGQDDVLQNQWWQSLLTGERTTDSRHHAWRGGVFLEDEIRLGSTLHASLGLRYDRHPTADRLSPRAALIFAPAGGTTVKALFGSAFRAPNEYERHYYPGQTDTRPETIDTLELVAEQALPGRLRLTASVFDNHIRDLITLTDSTGTVDLLDGASLFVNSGSLHSRGLDLALEAHRGKDLRLRAAYGYQHTRDEATGADISNSPRHLLKLETAVPLGSRFTGGAAMQYLSPRLTLRDDRTRPTTLVDLNVTMPGLWQHLDLSVRVRNLLDARWEDPASEEHVQRVIPQDGRTLSLRAVWSF
jgi:outer membrane cobalamin receptor